MFVGVKAQGVLTSCAIVLAGSTSMASAEDLYFQARTDFQAYEVMGPSAPAFLSRRRLVQNVGFRYSDAFQEEGELRWDLRARVRLDHEFGRSCLVAREYCLASTSSGQPDDYLYLTEDARMDLPMASLGLRGLPGHSEARLGRQLLTLPHRMRRIDGLSLSSDPLGALSLHAHAGFLPLARSLLGSDTFAPQGALGDPTTRSVADRPRLWSLGFGGTLRLPLGFMLDVGAEELGEPSGSVERSLYAGIDWRYEQTMVRTMLVWDPSRERIADARARAEFLLGTSGKLAVMTGAEAVYHRPRFDLGTVWAFFEVAPTTQVRLGGELSWDENYAVGARLMSRSTHFSDQPDQQDYGVEVDLRADILRFKARVTGFSWFGDLEHWRGARLHLERMISAFVSLRAGATLWDLSDPTRKVLEGLSVSEYAGVAWNLARGTDLSAELQHGYSDFSGHRWRLMSALSIEVWR